MRGRRDGLRTRNHGVIGTTVAVLVLLTGVRPVDAQDRPGGTAFLRGGVIDAVSEVSLDGVTVTLVPLQSDLGSPRMVVTGMSGYFEFAGIVPGPYRFSVSLIGYETVADSFEIEEDAELDVAVRLSAVALELAPLDVEVDQGAMDGPLVEFERRRRTLTGTFLDREDILAAAAVEFSDLMRTIPGMRIQPVGAFGTRILMRNCRPDLWLDGVQVTEVGDVDAFMKPEELAAVEVYKGSIVPTEFGNTRCGAIAAWSHHQETGANANSLRRQLLMAGGILAAFFIIRNQGR